MEKDEVGGVGEGAGYFKKYLPSNFCGSVEDEMEYWPY